MSSSPATPNHSLVNRPEVTKGHQPPPIMKLFTASFESNQSEDCGRCAASLIASGFSFEVRNSESGVSFIIPYSGGTSYSRLIDTVEAYNCYNHS